VSSLLLPFYFLLLPYAALANIRRKISLDRPLVMGILNVTPDSFSDGGRFLAAGDALARRKI
jgi:dihydropteroate synthase